MMGLWHRRGDCFIRSDVSSSRMSSYTRRYVRLISWRHVRAQDVSQVYRRVRQMHNGTGNVITADTGHPTHRLGLCEEFLEDRRVPRERTAVDAKFDIAREDNYRPVVKPELSVPLTCALFNLALNTSNLLSLRLARRCR